MTPTPDAARRWRPTAAARSMLAALATAVGLAGCGSGDPAEEFRPTRLVAFGDESTLMTPEGLKFSIDYYDTDTATIDCKKYPIWVQSVASAYGLTFAECNPDGKTVNAFMRAKVGATVSDLRAQWLDYLQNDAPNDRDVVTVMLGVADVLEVYAQYPTVSSDDLKNELEARGRNLALGVNQVTDYGPRVILITPIDIGKSPFALAEKALHTDTDRAKLLTDFVNAFIRGVRLNIVNDGHKVGMVFGDQETQFMVSNPGGYGLRNVTLPACVDAAPYPDTSPLPLLGCSSASGDLVTDATGTNFLWADTLRFGPTGQARLANIAVNRAKNNPF